ncbi:MAG: hypothetical protein QF464_18050, partial [Myxococcota bacterium]|nr:hypothetical protein [Myxococcota bacterium]
MLDRAMNTRSPGTRRAPVLPLLGLVFSLIAGCAADSQARRGSDDRAAADRRASPDGRAAASATSKGEAEAAFRQLEPRFEAFRSKRVTSVDLEVQKDTLTWKMNALKELVSAYGEIDAVASPSMGHAAGLRVAQLYWDFADTISNLPSPPGLSSEEMDLYRSSLEAQADKLLDVSKEKLRALVAMADGQGLDNAHIRQARALLSEVESTATQPAEPALRRLEPRFQAFRRLRVVAADPAAQRETLERKKREFQALEAAYTELLKPGSLSLATGAQLRVAQLYWEFAATFLGIPEPDGLAPDEMDAYRNQLEDLASNFEDEALKKL